MNKYNNYYELNVNVQYKINEKKINFLIFYIKHIKILY